MSRPGRQRGCFDMRISTIPGYVARKPLYSASPEPPFRWNCTLLWCDVAKLVFIYLPRAGRHSKLRRNGVALIVSFDSRSIAVSLPNCCSAPSFCSVCRRSRQSAHRPVTCIPDFPAGGRWSRAAEANKLSGAACRVACSSAAGSLVRTNY